MNHKFLVKISNGIGLFAILLLVYWVFTFILVTVFGLKIFRENLTETFTLSILGILALMGGALMLNIMFNLTRIAERNLPEPIPSKQSKKMIGGLLLLFPIITALLFTGDYLSAKKKEQFLKNSAEKIMTNHVKTVEQIANYQFTSQYIATTGQQLEFLSQLDTSFNNSYVLVPDQINDAAVYLVFDQYGIHKMAAADNEIDATQHALIHTTLHKTDYVKQIELNDRLYLDQTFKNNSTELRFKSNNGKYELYYPYQVNGKTKAVFYFSDYQRYGKYGS